MPRLISIPANRLFTRAIFLFALACPAFLAGCGAYQTVQDKVSFDMSAPPVILQEQWARREPPLVYVHPAEKSDAQFTALFMPFRVTQPITDPEMIGYSQARTVWQTWLSRRLFSVLEFDGDHGPYRRDIALALARQKGADLAIGGFVTYYYAGGSEWDSQVALQVEMYDTASGQLVWSMGQSALMPAREIKDYIIFATQTRLPSDPMHALAKTMAEDMADVLAKWVPKADKGTNPVLLNAPKEKEVPGQPAHPSF